MTTTLIAENKGNENKVDELISLAKRKRLSRHKQWLRLGHWQKSVFRKRWKSQADGLDFFIAGKAGIDSPDLELVATIRAFVGDAEMSDEHAICRFPARYIWLRKELNIDSDRNRLPQCKKFVEYINVLQPNTVTLVFSSYFLSKAASAFGHTFLRIDKEGQGMTRERRELLDIGIDYSAEVTTKNSLMYVINGLAGMFHGTFRRLPYYYKVREYNDFESRDLWEYQLNFQPKQVDLLVAHLWEMGQTYFDYFYLTENCSYHILSILEVANTDLDLIEQLKNPVIPADTIKTLFSVPGLVKDVEFRPSLYTQFKSRVNKLSAKQQKAISSLYENPMWTFPSSFTGKEKIQVIDATQDFVDMNHPKEILHHPDSQPALDKLTLLKRRSKIRLSSEELNIDTPLKKMPQVGHGSKRVGMGLASTGGLGEFLTFNFRLTLHDLADAPNGYPETSGIEFFRFRGRFSLQREELQLEEFSIIRMNHLVPFDRFSRGISWKFDVGGGRVYDGACDNCFVGKVRFAGGVAKSLFDDRILFFATADTIVEAGPSLNGIADAPIRLGVGPSLGARVRLSDKLVFLSIANSSWLPRQSPQLIWDVRTNLRWSITDEFAMDAEVNVRNQFNEGRFSWLFYY